MADAAVSIPAKDPAKVRAGSIGGRTRWAGHARKMVRLDDLTAPQRRLVLALVEAAKNEADQNAARREAERDPNPEAA